MIELIKDLWSALQHQVTRGKLNRSYYSKDGQRTLLQGIHLADETHLDIELLLPYGMSALPVGKTADYIIFQVNATRDHKVAMTADDPALRIPDLQLGEFGFRNGRGSQVVWRNNKLEVTTTQDDLDVTVQKGNLNVVTGQGNVNLSVTGNVVMAATGHIAMTAQPGTITANGNVLG